MDDMGRRGVFALLLVTVLAAACTSSAAGPPSRGTPALHATEAALLPAGVDDLPAMDVEAFDELRRQVRGTPMVVNLWASWCGPCEDEAPDLAEAGSMYGDRVQFLGIDVQDNRSDAAAFIREHGWSYASVFDVPGAIMAALGITGPPATLFYAADGTLVRTVRGRIAPEDLVRGIRELLDERPLVPSTDGGGL
jgi:cytochrome c biogenesis protein CcmG, thiol:disulfide interchange protein DsbE